MVTALSENGYSRVYVTEDGFNYVGSVFRDDIKKRMVKL
jgi:CBS domain-containing protein